MSSKKCDTCEYGGSNCHCFHRDSLYSGTSVDIWRSRYLKMGNSIFYIDPTAENCPGYKNEEVIMQDISRTEITKAMLGVGYPISWIEKVVNLSFDSEGVMDLLQLWFDADGKNRKEVVLDLDECIEDHRRAKEIEKARNNGVMNK